MDKKILIVGHINHGITPLTQAMKLALDRKNVCIVAPNEVPKPLGSEPEPFVITNPYENMPKLIEQSGFVSRKERRKRERELKKRR